MMSTKNIISAVGATALIVLLAFSLSSVIASPSQDLPPVEMIPDGPERMNIRIEPAQGVPAVDEESALRAAAKAVPGFARIASSATAEYVLFSKDDYYTELPDGSRAYKFQDSPVWLVTYTGIEIRSHGGNPTINREAVIVVDAQTGEALFEFSYQ